MFRLRNDELNKDQESIVFGAYIVKWLFLDFFHTTVSFSQFRFFFPSEFLVYIL